MRIVFLTPALARLVPDRPVVLEASPLAREILLALTESRVSAGAGPDRHPAARVRLLRVLVDELRAAPEQPLQLPESPDDLLRALSRALRENPADNRSLAALGTLVGANPRTLSRLFRRELGMTFYEWRTQVRIHHALVLLAGGSDITRTAYACGWSNPSDFIVAFTRVLGTTPGHYRTQHRGTIGL